MSINKKALIERVSLTTGQPKNSVETVLDATLEEIMRSLFQLNNRMSSNVIEGSKKD